MRGRCALTRRTATTTSTRTCAIWPQRRRHGRDSRRGRSSRGRPAWWSRRALLGPHRGSLSSRPHRRERRRGSDVPLHDGGLGRQDQDGPVIAVRDAATDRAEGQVRRRLRVRHRCRSPRHRRGERRPPAAESLSVRGHSPPLRASAGLAGRRRRRQDGGEHQHDRSCRREARPPIARGAGRLQVVRRWSREWNARLRRRGERRRVTPAPRRNGVDDGQGRDRARPALGRDHGRRRPRSGRAVRRPDDASLASRRSIASRRSRLRNRRND